DADEDALVLDQRRLVHLRAGEAREARALGLNHRLDGIALRSCNCSLGEFERARHEGDTPTWTLRNRAGAAPWLTCACCPGWPLPQFVKPYSTQLSGPATASSEPQKTGVTPVYVASRTIWPNFPCLISQAPCVPNWKWSRLRSFSLELSVPQCPP